MKEVDRFAIYSVSSVLGSVDLWHHQQRCQWTDISQTFCVLYHNGHYCFVIKSLDYVVNNESAFKSAQVFFSHSTHFHLRSAIILLVWCPCYVNVQSASLYCVILHSRSTRWLTDYIAKLIFNFAEMLPMEFISRHGCLSRFFHMLI